MLKLTDKQECLYRLLFTKEFSAEKLMAELAGGQYTPEDVGRTGCKYVDRCINDLEQDDYNDSDRGFDEIIEGYYSSHLLTAMQILLEHGLDPNAIYTEESGHYNILYELHFIDNGYIAADALALLLEHGGDPNIQIDGSSLVRHINFDLWYDLANQEDRRRYDALVHFWMVLVGYGAKLEDGRGIIDMCKGHDVSELKQHRDFYFGAIHSDRSEDGMEIAFFNKYTNWEIGRW